MQKIAAFILFSFIALQGAQGSLMPDSGITDYQVMDEMSADCEQVMSVSECQQCNQCVFSVAILFDKYQKQHLSTTAQPHSAPRSILYYSQVGELDNPPPIIL